MRRASVRPCPAVLLEHLSLERASALVVTRHVYCVGEALLPQTAALFFGTAKCPMCAMCAMWTMPMPRTVRHPRTVIHVPSTAFSSFTNDMLL